MKNSSLFGNKNIRTPTTSYSAPLATPAPNALPPLYETGGKRAPSELVFLVLPLDLFCIAAIHICKRHIRRSNRNEAEMANQTGGDGRLSENGLWALNLVATLPLSASSSSGTLENLERFEQDYDQVVASQRSSLSAPSSSRTLGSPNDSPTISPRNPHSPSAEFQASAGQRYCV